MKKAILIIISFLVIAVFAFIITIPIVNDNVAKKTAKKLVDTQLPEQTEYIESVSRAGKLVGNGNGMQYFGAILIKSELSLDELKAYYSAYADNEWEYVVEKQADNDIQVIECAILKFQTEISGDKYFIVYSWGNNNGIFHDWDLRGH